MHRQLFGDLLIGQALEQLEPRARLAVDDDGALAAMLGPEFRAGIAAIIVMRGAPDVLDALLRGSSP